MRVFLSRFFRLLLLLAVGSAARAETLTLDDCLREAAEHNPAIAAQRSNIEQASGTRLTLRSRALPRLGISALGGQQGDQGTTIVRAHTVTDAQGNKTLQPTQITNRGANYFALGTGNLSQPLFDAAIPASWRRGNLETAIARQNFAAVASAQLHDTRLQFYQAIFQRDNAAVLQSVAERIDANTKAIGDLVKAGLANQQAQLQAQVQRANLGPSILASQGGYRTALTALLGLMGRDLGQTGGGSDPIRRVSLSGSLEDESLLSFDAPKAAALALERRPDLIALRDTLRSSEEDARIIRAGYYPRVLLYISGDVVPQNFVSNTTRSNNSVRANDDVRTTEARFGARYDWTVIDTGAVRGAAQRTDRLREITAAALQRAEQNVPRGLALLRAQNAANESQIDALRANLSTAEETLNIVSAAVAQGTSSQLEFLDAQTGLLTTRASLLQTQLQAAMARAEFDRLTGGYLRFVSPESSDGEGKQADKKP